MRARWPLAEVNLADYGASATLPERSVGYSTRVRIAVAGPPRWPPRKGPPEPLL